MTKTKQKKKPTLKTAAHHSAKRIFVPHKGNDYRPHLIRWPSLVSVAIIALSVQLAYGFVTTGQLEVLGRRSNITVSELVADTNKERAKVGLSELKLNDQLNQAAFAKAKDMFANNYWAHESPSGVTPWKWLGDVGYNYDVAGENLAKNYTDASSTVEAWMASPTHRANVLGERYTDVGFAVVEDVLNGKETDLVVAYYGLPADTSVAVAGTVATNTPHQVITGKINPGIGNPIAYFGSAIQALSPVTLGILGWLVIIGIVATAAHHYRYKLPKTFQKNWRLHHAAYKLGGVAIMIVSIVFTSGGGQI